MEEGRIMEITLLIKSILGLVVILGILLFLFLYTHASKKKEAASKAKKEHIKKKKERPSHELKDLLAVIRNKQSTTQELEQALDLMLKYHGHIHPKLGVRAHPDFDIYAEVIFRICRHPNTNKDIIVKFDRELERLNPEYMKEINDTLTKGLNSRGL